MKILCKESKKDIEVIINELLYPFGIYKKKVHVNNAGCMKSGARDVNPKEEIVGRACEGWQHELVGARERADAGRTRHGRGTREARRGQARTADTVASKLKKKFLFGNISSGKICIFFSPTSENHVKLLPPNIYKKAFVLPLEGGAQKFF